MYGSIYMTIAISVERVLAICYPFLFPPLDRKSRHYIIPVTITGMKLLEWFYLLVNNFSGLRQNKRII